jgi:YD repeat-containing protein
LAVSNERRSSFRGSKVGTVKDSPDKPRVVSAVELPDGRAYHTKYNSHGKLVRVTLPAGVAWSTPSGSGVPKANSGVKEKTSTHNATEIMGSADSDQ